MPFTPVEHVVSMTPAVSFVIPFLNEEQSLGELHTRIAKVMDELAMSYEVVFVDDGSTDDSVKKVCEIIDNTDNVRLVELQGNFGKSAALAAGFAESRGGIVFTMDADLQDDPVEISRFLEKLDEGHDLVTGYKKTRNDPSLSKVLPSRVFNFLVRRLTGLRLHDINCGFKAYRRKVVDNLQLHGELHRFTPVLAHWKRFRIAELVVTHHPRKHGSSKYGGRRFYRGLVDLLTVFFLLKYDRRPAHFFGMPGGLATLSGFGICIYMTVQWFLGESIGNRPLLTLGVLLIVVGIQILALGLLAELFVQGRRDAPYVIKRKYDRTLRAGTSEHDTPTDIHAAG